MVFKDTCHFFQEQILKVNMPQPLLHRACAVSDDLHDLGNEVAIRSDLVVPGLYKLLQDRGNDRVQLDVDLIGAGQWRQELLKWRLVNVVGWIFRSKTRFRWPGA